MGSSLGNLPTYEQTNLIALHDDQTFIGDAGFLGTSSYLLLDLAIY